MEAVKGQKHYISVHTLALKLNIRFIPQRQFCLPKYICSTMDMIKSNIFIIWSSYNNEITTHRHGQSEVNGLGNQILLQIENMHIM